MRHKVSKCLQSILRGFWYPLMVCLVLPCSAVAGKSKPVVVVSWDGAAGWVVERLLAEGRLPNVAKLKRTGAHSEYCIPAFPSKTACGHAAIWTGAYGDINGISGNSVPLLPRADHTLLEQQRGFLSTALRAEPLWLTAAKAGKRVTILSATHSDPPGRWIEALRSAHVPADRYRSFSGFEQDLQIQDGRVWDGKDLQPASLWERMPDHIGTAREFRIPVGERTFYVLVYDDPRDPTVGLDTLLVRADTKKANAQTEFVLKPVESDASSLHFSPSLPVRKAGRLGYTAFRLFALSPDGSMTLYQRPATGLRGAATPQQLADYYQAYGGFHDDPFSLYQQGAFGKPLWEGGEGIAERRILECLRQDTHYLKQGTRYALKHWKPDLLFHYTPQIDSAGHTWMGVLDPESPCYKAELAEKLWPFYAAVYAIQDEWLGDILRQVGEGGIVCLVSDHGMAGVGKTFAPNVALERSGLMAQTAEGTIDIARTKICFPPWGEYFAVVNSTEWKKGLVMPTDREVVLQQAIQSLLSARDPDTGRNIVTGVFRPDSLVGLGMGGSAGGDLYLEFAPGYVPINRLRTSLVEPIAGPIGAGVHGFFPLRRKMQSIFFLSGEGIRPNLLLRGVRQIDIAPTLARLMNIPVPQDASGHILGEVFRK